jgi:predicted secreted protein with PEFG-CTERM motif
MVKSILDISKSMKIKTSTFLGLLVIVAGLAATMPSAFAAEVSVPAGSSVPGCEDTNECWFPAEISVGVGETVTWSNDDTAAHTVTAGDLGVDSDAVGLDFPNGFDSSLFLAGTTFDVTFDTAGTFPYFCMVHPWMVGTVIVGEAMKEAMMSGAYLGLDIDPMLPFDNTANDMVTLSFTAKSDELKGTTMTGNVIDHLDYKVIISKDGSELWSEQFHDHDGNLELEITPSEGTSTKAGGQEVGTRETKAFRVKAPVFMDNGNYQVTAQIVGIEFNPLPTPLKDDFNIQVVPEFGTITMMILGVSIVSIIAITAKSKIIPKL